MIVFDGGEHQGCVCFSKQLLNAFVDAPEVLFEQMLLFVVEFRTVASGCRIAISTAHMPAFILLLKLVVLGNFLNSFRKGISRIYVLNRIRIGLKQGCMVFGQVKDVVRFLTVQEWQQRL